MQNIITWLIIAVIVIGGGWYWYSTSSTTDSTPTPTTQTSTETPALTEGEIVSITITGSPFKFDPSSFTVKKGQTVKVHFVNSEGSHDWVLDEFNVRTKQIGAGASEDVTFVADKVGSFEYYCSVGQHRQMGMKGTLTVTE